MSHFWRRLKKGFTAVELAIVIAIIAILIAVIVPTFINILNNARKSNDSTLVYNANQTLQIEETLTGSSYSNVTDAITTLLNNGYTVESLTATADDCTLAYDTSTNTFVVLESYTTEDLDSEYITKNICIVNPDSATISEAVTSGIKNFCVYDTSETVTIETTESVNIDVYTSGTTTTVNAAKAVVNYYGSAETVDITSVDSNSFHLYGKVTTIRLSYGHVEFCDGSYTGTLVICGNDTSYTFTKDSTTQEVPIGSIIYQSDENGTYTPAKITYNDGVNETTVYDKKDNSATGSATASIAAALYKYGISYRANEDKATVTLVYNDGSTADSYVYTNNDGAWKVSLSNPTRDGYQFGGWFLDSNCTGTQITTGATVKSDLTLYAKWTKIYTVTFDLNYEGTTETTTPTAQTVVNGKTATEPTAPTRTAYNFTGWYTDKECTKAYSFNTAVKDNLTLYAGWTIKTYTVTFYNSYGYDTDNSSYKVYSLTIDYGETIASGELSTYVHDLVSSDGTPYYPDGTVNNSKKFGGWYTDSSCTTIFAFANESNATTITSDLDVYAKWVDVYVTVTLVLNDGTFTTDLEGYTKNDDGTYTSNENSIIYGSTISSISELTKESYTFTGWYTDSNLTTKFVFGSDDSATKLTEDTTLYAGWDVSVVTVNGVTYTKVTLSSSGTVTFGTTNTITVNNITSYWVVTGYSNLSAYYGDTWLVLENEINGYPVLEIAAGALANVNSSKTTSNSLTNVLVPENIVMVGSRAFLDNKGITSIVFLADKVYFSRDSKESYVVNSTDYYNGVTSGGEDSKNYPFYGCTENSSDNSCILTVYYKTAYSTQDGNSTALNSGTFVVKRSGSNSNYTYYRTKNDDSKTSSSSLKTINWLNIATTAISQALTCGSYARGDFDWAGALTDAVAAYGKENSVAYCSYNGYVFVACSYSDIYSYIESYMLAAINSFTAEYGEYINGYTVSTTEAAAYANGHDVTFTINPTNNNYYLLNVSQSVVNESNAEIASDDWTIVSGVNSSGSTTVTYSASVGESKTAVTVDVTYSGSVQYFSYKDAAYSTYFSTKNDIIGVYGTGSVTISGTSGYNYKMYSVNGTTLTEVVTSAEVTANTNKVTDVALMWTQTTDPYIYIISNISFTYTDGTNSTTISASKTGSPLLYSGVKRVEGNSLLSSNASISTTEAGYYFLGWAYMADKDNDGTGDTLTFTTITANTTTFNNTNGNVNVYYAIWAYSKLELAVTVATDTTTLSNPTSVKAGEGTFVGWYTDGKFTSSASELTDKYTYYAKTAENTITKNGVTYTFTKGESFTFTPKNTSNPLYGTDTCTISTTYGGYYLITGYTSNYTYGTNDWLVLENTINSFNVVGVAEDALKGSAITNVIVPANIAYIAYEAFNDCSSLKNIVFLADTIYLNNNGGRTSYPFVGCTNSNLNIYCSKYVGLGENNTTVYYYAFNKSSNSSSYSYITPSPDWLYIDTTVSSLVGGSYDIDGYSADDIQSDIIEALQKFAGDSYYAFGEDYSNEGFVFIPYSLGSTSTDSEGVTLSSYITTYVTDCIESYTASTLGYINGHTVSVALDTKTAGTNTVSTYDITVNVGDCKPDGTFTAYYKISEENLLGTTNEEDETTTYSSWNTSEISYSEISTDSDVSTITVTYTLDDTDSATLYATYSAPAGSFEIYDSALYIKNGTTFTVAADNYSYTLDGIVYNDADGTEETVTSGQSYFVTTAASADVLTIKWTAVTKSEYTVTVYSDISFTLDDSSTAIAEKTNETVDLGNETTALDSMNVTATKSNYYFLGWAYNDSSNDNALTFTSNITYNTTNTYYAIWGYNAATELSGSHNSSDSDTTSFPTVTGKDGTLYGWYTGYSTITYGSYAYESFDDNSYVEALSGTQTIYYARMSFTLTISFTGSSSSKTTFSHETSLKSNTTLSYTTDSGNNDYTYKAYLSGILQGYCLEIVVGRFNASYEASRPKFYVYTDYATYASNSNNVNGNGSRYDYYNYVNVQGKKSNEDKYRTLLDSDTVATGFNYSYGSVPAVDYTYVMATSVNCSMSLTSTY